MDCPRCSVEMTEIAGEDSLLQRCSDCGGLWLDVADVTMGTAAGLFDGMLMLRVES